MTACRVNALYPSDIDNDQLNSLLTTIKNEGDEIEMKDKEIERLQARLEKSEATVTKLRKKYETKEITKTQTAKKTTRASKTKKNEAKEASAKEESPTTTKDETKA